MTTTPETAATCFAQTDEVADFTAIIVTYNSAGDIGGLLDTLPAAAPGLRMRVVIVDNDSTDDIGDVLADRAGVTFVRAGGNLGYSGGINVGRRHLGATRAVLVLNPDLRLAPASVTRLMSVLAEPGVGAAVPRILDDDGATSPSLRREPTILRTLGNAVLGKRWPDRPAWLSDVVRQSELGDDGGTVEWASGAALLISADLNAEVGPWDEGFFLYSEETDYCRRLRQTGRTIRYVHDAVVTHRGGGSGSGSQLVAVGTLSRLRYYRKYHGPAATAGFRLAITLNELLRVHRAGNRRALRAIWSRRSRATLPRASALHPTEESTP